MKYIAGYQATLKLVISFLGMLSAASRASEALPSVGRRLLCEGYRVYFDHGTEQCELCSEICRNAEIQGTERQCRDNCPQYLVAMSCEGTGGWFYDQRLGACRPCCDISDNTVESMQKCADFMVPPPSSNQVPSHLHSEAIVADNLPAAITPSPCALNSKLHNPSQRPPNDTNVPVWVVLVVIVVAVVLGIFIVLAAFNIVLMRTSTQKPYKTVTQREGRGSDEEPDRASGEGAYPVEESRRKEPQSAAVVVADGTIRSMTIPVKTAFADLSAGHDGSRCEPV